MAILQEQIHTCNIKTCGKSFDGAENFVLHIRSKHSEEAKNNDAIVNEDLYAQNFYNSPFPWIFTKFDDVYLWFKQPDKAAMQVTKPPEN